MHIPAGGRGHRRTQGPADDQTVWRPYEGTVVLAAIVSDPGKTPIPSVARDVHVVGGVGQQVRGRSIFVEESRGRGHRLAHQFPDGPFLTRVPQMIADEVVRGIHEVLPLRG